MRESANSNKEYQTVARHLTGTAELCRGFASAFGAEADGELAGLAHDIGKCTDAFQDRLLNDGPIVDHATAGAMACAMRGSPYVSACVAGHYGGLPDFGNMKTARKDDGTFYGRLLKGRDEQCLGRCGESGVALSPPTVSAAQKLDPLQASFWTRMLYSCLVDADFLDTERFMNGDPGRGGYDDIPTLLARLQAYIEPWQQPKTELNRLRCEILNACLSAGSKPKGIYTLTVPTGGGKTVASLAFALRHAAEHRMQRVIYVIPYTSIIDQNAQVFRDILGSGNVLEHHSGVQFDLSDGAPAEDVRKALATENWDMPVVVTTAVQFFESMYAARSSQCRKLHNLANSVIIFDEAQMLPLPHLRPCVAAMASLAEQLSSQHQLLCIVNSRKAAQSIYALLPPVLFQKTIEVAREALGGGRDIAEPETMAQYFCILRDLTGDALDKQGVIKAFTQGIKGCEFPFRTVAEKFRLIDRNTYTVYIPYGEGAALFQRLQDGECSKGLNRKLGRYAVSVYDKHFQALHHAGALLTAREIPTLDDDSAILTDLTLYSETMGLSLEPETGKAEFI